MSALGNEFLPHIWVDLAIPQFGAVSHLPNGTSVADSTQKYVLRLGRARWILIVSSKDAPLVVHRAIDRQRLAKSLLQGPAAEAIEFPMTDGFYGEQSYGLWPMRTAVSSNRILQKLDKLRLAPRVFWWLGELAAQTAGPANPSSLAANAQRLCGIPGLSNEIRSCAKRAGEDFLSGRVPAIQLLQHGDLWFGNVLKAPTKAGFIVIDWAGARLDGAPFFDLVKFACSIGASKATLRRHIEAHSSVLRCQPAHAMAYVLSALGQLYEVREYFPESMFVQLCHRQFEALTG